MRDLLFVTYQNKDWEVGLPYAIDLAKTLNKGISILLLHQKKLAKGFESLMAAVTFAEAYEHETAREIMRESETENTEDTRIPTLLAKKCRECGVPADVHTEEHDVFSSVRNFLKEKTSIDMVVLSPSVTDSKDISAKELSRLAKRASRPIVTMTRHACAN